MCIKLLLKKLGWSQEEGNANAFWFAQLMFLQVHGAEYAQTEAEIVDILKKHPVTCESCQKYGDGEMGICGRDRYHCFYVMGS